MLFDRESWPEDVKLRAHSHLKMHFIDLIDDAVSSDVSIARGGSENASDHRKQSGFTCTIGP